MDINQNAPVIAHEQLHIAADVQTVWDVLSDIEQWPRWNKAVRSVSVHGPVASGTSFDWKAGPGTIKSSIAEVDAPNRIVWTGVTFGTRAVDAFSFEARTAARWCARTSPGRASSRGSSARAWSAPCARASATACAP